MAIAVKAGSTELSREAAENIISKNEYVCNYGGVYQLSYDEKKDRFRAKKIVNVKGIAQRGRFYVFDKHIINRILGYIAIA